MNLESDRAMLELYRQGHRPTLERLYRHFSPVVMRALSRGFRVHASGVAGTGSVGPLDLDAAHQETFVRAFGASARLHYDGLQPFEPYLLSIARSAAVDVLRAQGKLHSRSIPLDEHEATVQLHDERATPEEQALRAEVEAAVRSFLGTLGEVDRRFATARFIEGLSQERAGATCGLSRQEARTRENRLKAACLAHLGPGGFLDSLPEGTRAAVTVLVLELLLKGTLS